MQAEKGKITELELGYQKMEKYKSLVV